MKKYLSLLCALLLVGCLCCGCNSGKPATDPNTDAKLQQQQQQIEALQETVSQLQQSVSRLTELLNQNNSALQGEIQQLQETIAAYETRIQLLESVTETDPNKVYKFGETFTLKNNGRDLYSIKLIDYSITTSYYGLTIEILNLFMPSSIGLGYYIDVCAFNETANKFYPAETDHTNRFISIGEKKTIRILFNDYPDKQSISHFLVGIPGRVAGSIIPYATFEL